ncbi:MAG: penicillin-binding protein 1C [bacterium]
MENYPKILYNIQKIKSSEFWYFINKKSSKIFILIIFILLLLDNFYPPLTQKEYSQSIYSAENVLLTGYLTRDDKWRLFTAYDDVSPQLIKAIIEKEDKLYYWHWGVNPFAVMRAFVSNIFGGRTIGASTITMQVIRMYYPSNRTYFSKIKEMIKAFQLEFHYSKKEILEIYLSCLPYGGNVEGVKSASYIYFNQSPNKLSLAQSVLLACIPNNPNKYRIDRNSRASLNFRNKFLKIFLKDNTFNQMEIKDAINEPIKNIRYKMPNLTPQFSLFLANKTNLPIIKSTLKINIQQKAEALLKNYVERAKAKQVNNGAVLIIDNKTMNVICYCGSSDFNDIINSGQVNGITAIRSPGSALKPALYALGLELGLITPKSKMLDIPLDYGGYAPENYDLSYNGEVTTEFALVNSLNLPAVRLLKAVTLESFIKLLTTTGFDEINKSKSKLGLSTILGGCGVRLDEMVRLYSVFANSGKVFPLNYFGDNEEKNKGVQILSSEACFLISDMLSKNVRPDFPVEMIDMTGRPKIAWKTGTSYGKRDAWAIGYNPNYTVGVWMGNFSGVGSPHLSGAEMAVPLLFDLFNMLGNKNNKWFGRPKNIGLRKICAESGFIPDYDCNFIIDDYYIKNKSSQKVCDLYKDTYVSLDEQIEYCVSCLSDSGYKKKKYPFYDPELLIWYEENNVKTNKPPKHNPNCSVRLSEEGPKIISPTKDYEYYIEESAKQQIMLQAASQLNTNFHYWYVNNIYLGKIKSTEKLFFNPKQGKNYILCMDDKGRTSEVVIRVKFY